MKKRENIKRNSLPLYDTKFRNLILDYLRKNQSNRTSITDLEKIKDENGFQINRQTLRNNLRILTKLGEIKPIININPSLETNKYPVDEEIFIELSLPSTINGYPQLLLKLMNNLTAKNDVEKNSAELFQLFLTRKKTNLMIEAHLQEKELQHYKQYLEYETYVNSEGNLVNYSKKDIKNILKTYKIEHKKETYEPALQNAETEAKKLIDFLIHGIPSDKFKKKVANQLSIPDEDGKYNLNFDYEIQIQPEF